MIGGLSTAPSPAKSSHRLVLVDFEVLDPRARRAWDSNQSGPPVQGPRRALPAQQRYELPNLPPAEALTFALEAQRRFLGADGGAGLTALTESAEQAEELEEICKSLREAAIGAASACLHPHAYYSRRSRDLGALAAAARIGGDAAFALARRVTKGTGPEG